MHIYLHIDVAFVLICHSRNTKSNIDDYRKMQKALITTSNGNRLVLQH